jgi:beta-phosphoglucomutase-like phosphatase (HAD superfamily)
MMAPFVLSFGAARRFLLEPEDVIVVEYDVEAIEIAGKTAHFHVVALPHDDDVVAVARESGDGAMRDVYERAGGFDHR